MSDDQDSPRVFEEVAERDPAALLRIAGDPATSRGRLRFLARLLKRDIHNADIAGTIRREILAAVASNPSTPPEVVASLAAEYPAEVSMNSALPALSQKKPDLAQCLIASASLRLLAQEKLPASLVARIAAVSSHPETVEAARMHVVLAGEADSDWQEQVRDYWRNEAQRATRNYHLRQGLIEVVELDLLPRWVAGPEPWPGSGTVETHARFQYRIQQAESEDGYEKVKEVYADIRRALDPNTSTKVLQKLVAGDHDFIEGVAMAALLNPNAPFSVRRVAALRDKGHQKVAASDPRTEPELLEELAIYTQYPQVRRLIWKHPHASGGVRARAPEILWKWITKTLWAPRVSPLLTFAVLCSPALPERYRENAARSGDWRRRLAAALALSVGKRLLGSLCHDGNRLVRAAARARLADPKLEFTL